LRSLVKKSKYTKRLSCFSSQTDVRPIDNAFAIIILTFKDLQKLAHSQLGPEQFQLLQKLKDKPFWIWDQRLHKQEDIKTKGDCCFNHIIGLPSKDKVEKPLFGYEKLIYDSLLISDWVYS
jgi:hypothetical protein